MKSSSASSTVDSQTAVSGFMGGLREAVAGGGVEVQSVDLLQVGDPPQRLLAERALPLEGVEDDPFQENAQRQVIQLRQRLQHLHQPFFHPYTGLHPLHHPPVRLLIVHGPPPEEIVPWYQGTVYLLLL